MTIRYAILGLLSWQPCSGYDLKKIITTTPGLYWSGNNNQVYTSLIDLRKEGLVGFTVQTQESLPAKKIYTITEAGRAALRAWVMSSPEPPELRSAFLVQLAWADLLDPAEMDGLLARYEEEVRMQMQMQHEKNRRAQSPDRTPREVYLWRMIAENTLSAYENELAWLSRLRHGLEEYK